jgi:hypothetical protein
MNTEYYTKRDELLNFIKDLKSIIQSIRTGDPNNQLNATLGNITYTTQSCIEYPHLLLYLLIEINEKIKDQEPSSITNLVSSLKQNSTSPTSLLSSQNPERILKRTNAFRPLGKGDFNELINFVINKELLNAKVITDDAKRFNYINNNILIKYYKPFVAGENSNIIKSISQLGFEEGNEQFIINKICKYIESLNKDKKTKTKFLNDINSSNKNQIESMIGIDICRITLTGDYILDHITILLLYCISNIYNINIVLIIRNENKVSFIEKQNATYTIFLNISFNSIHKSYLSECSPYLLKSIKEINLMLDSDSEKYKNLKPPIIPPAYSES